MKMETTGKPDTQTNFLIFLATLVSVQRLPVGTLIVILIDFQKFTHYEEEQDDP